MAAHLGAADDQAGFSAHRQVGARFADAFGVHRPARPRQALVFANLVEDGQAGRFVPVDHVADRLVAVEFEVFEWGRQHGGADPQLQDGAHQAEPAQAQVFEKTDLRTFSFHRRVLKQRPAEAIWPF